VRLVELRGLEPLTPCTCGTSLGCSTLLGPSNQLVDSVHPDPRSPTFAQGADLSAMVAAGYAPLGRQRVWVREQV